MGSLSSREKKSPVPVFLRIIVLTFSRRLLYSGKVSLRGRRRKAGAAASVILLPTVSREWEDATERRIRRFDFLVATSRSDDSHRAILP